MGQITLRGLDPEIEIKIRQMANYQKKSINKLLLELIYKNEIFQRAKEKPKTDSLKKLAGGWSQKEGDRFSESIEICEQVDGKLWK